MWLENADGSRPEWYVNNWFHDWGKQANARVWRLYADRKPPYDIYGWVGPGSPPFSAAAQKLIDQHRDAKPLYHGLLRRSDRNPQGFEIDLLHLIVRDPQSGGGGVVLGNPDTLPRLDTARP